jgi:predicted O-methyltransferase YrrM
VNVTVPAQDEAPAAGAEAARRPDATRTKLAQFLWDHMPIRLLLRMRPVVPELDPERLTIFLRALASRRDRQGAIVELGCYRGGTALEAYRALMLWEAERRYVCIDTFEGFVDEQFADDEKRGTPDQLRHTFDVNSARTVRRLFRHFGYDQLEAIEGDIAEIPESSLPGEISVCLLDVDLAGPTLTGLRRVYPRLAPGGIVLVDDCGEGAATGWRANDGYKEFCREAGLTEAYDAGFGIVERPG